MVEEAGRVYLARMLRSSAGLALLPLLVLAAPAHAADVTYWACQQTSCANPGSTLRIESPGELVSVTLDRAAKGPNYLVTAGGEIERLDTDLDVRDGKLFNVPASGRELVLSGGTFSLRSAGLTVADAQRPVIDEAPVPSLASGTLSVPVKASDDVGLAQVVATIDGVPAASATFGTCTEISADDATTDRVLGTCPKRGEAALSIDTTKYANAQHAVEIRVTDAAGNTQDVPLTVTFENATVQTPHDRPTPTPTPMPLGEIGILGDEATRYTSRDFLSIPKRPRASKAGTLTLTARCPLPKTCALRVSLTRAGKTYGSGRVTIKSKQRAKLTLKLTKAARAAVKKQPQSLRLTVAGYAGVAITVR